MIRIFSVFLVLFFLAPDAPSLAVDELEPLEAVVMAVEQTQPGLFNYLATVETSRIEEMMTRLTQGIPSDVKPPPTPVIYKFWQRNGESLVYASNTQATPFVEKMVDQISSNLAIELNEMLIPKGREQQRQELVKDAKVTLSDVALADKTIHHLEINFSEPKDLDQAFYLNGMRLPQKQIRSLVFDINAETHTVNEMEILVESGLQLTVEIRYLEVEGGMIPERFKVTSPDGKIDDLFQVTFTEVEGFKLPGSMLRTIQRPELQDQLEVKFKDYRVNQPMPPEVEKRLQNL